MADQDWVSVGEYDDAISAAIASKRLSEEGVPSRLASDRGGAFVWVPPESADAARAILSTPAVPEDELTALALKDPPPDDFLPTSAEETPSSVSESLETRHDPPPEAAARSAGLFIAPAAPYRGPVLLAHLALGALAVLAYMSRHPIHSAFYNAFLNNSGAAVALKSWPAVLPYLISAMISGSWRPQPRWRVTVFLALLVSMGVSAMLLTADVGGVGPGVGEPELLYVYLAQLALYLLAARWLLWGAPDANASTDRL